MRWVVRAAAAALVGAVGTAAGAGAGCDYRMAVSTASAEARRHFEEGVVLAWGFDFAGAARSFREAARQDGKCALCQWGIAYALGPSINHDMDPARGPEAHRAAARAVSLSAGATPLERGLIAAMAKRYAPKPRADRAALDLAYAEAMRALASEHAGNADALMLAAEAAMTLHARDYWGEDGAPRPWTPEILAWLERSLALAPRHPGANHYWIHAVEDSREPRRALAAADLLVQLCPGMGHLVHMASHVYMRTGRYHDATLANQRAIEADRARHGADAAYVEGYARHNVHFLWGSALMQGAGALAREAAETLARGADARALAGPRRGTAQHFLVLPLYTHLRFGDWDRIRAAPQPPASAPYARGVWHYARGVAAARGAEPGAARSHLRALEAISRRPALARSEVKSTHSHAALLAIAVAMLRAEVASAAGEAAAAIVHAQAAVARADGLGQDEPPMQLAFSARQRLGALLMQAGNPAEAEQAYRADLERLPENGYALAGLAASLRALGREAEARQADARLARAWAHADIDLRRLPF